MKKMLLSGIAILPFFIGVASAADRLSNAQMDLITAGTLSLPVSVCTGCLIPLPVSLGGSSTTTSSSGGSGQGRATATPDRAEAGGTGESSLLVPPSWERTVRLAASCPACSPGVCCGPPPQRALRSCQWRSTQLAAWQ